MVNEQPKGIPPDGTEDGWWEKSQLEGCAHTQDPHPDTRKSHVNLSVNTFV